MNKAINGVEIRNMSRKRSKQYNCRGSIQYESNLIGYTTPTGFIIFHHTESVEYDSLERFGSWKEGQIRSVFSLT